MGTASGLYIHFINAPVIFRPSSVLMCFMLGLLRASEDFPEGLTTCPRFSNLYFFWVSVSPRNTAQDVNTSWRCIFKNPVHSRRNANKENIKIREPCRKLSNLFGVSHNSRETSKNLKITI
jgi:hypothetical protein